MSSPPTDESDGTPHGTNYFFLITFLGLLIVFIICGVGSRIMMRRQIPSNGTFESLRRSPNGKLEVGEPPPLYESLFVLGKDRWSGLMPLSVSFLRENESKSIEHDLQALPSVTPTHCNTRNTTGRIFPSFNFFTSRRKNPSLQTQIDPEPRPPDTIQVAVIIVMPCRDLVYNHSKSPECLPEYQIGNISLQWKQDDPPNPQPWLSS